MNLSSMPQVMSGTARLSLWIGAAVVAVLIGLISASGTAYADGGSQTRPCDPLGDPNELLRCVHNIEPSFAGFRIDPSDDATLIVLLAGEEAAEDTAANVVDLVNRYWSRSFATSTVELVDYTAGQLLDWHDAILDTGFEEFSGVDLDEAANQIVLYRIDSNPVGIQALWDLTTELGIPSDAILVEFYVFDVFSEPPAQSGDASSDSATSTPQSLVQDMDPLVGGGGTTICTVGVVLQLAEADGYVRDGFLTAGHCPSGDIYVNRGSGTELAGTTVWDAYHQGIDAEFIEMSEDTDVSLGLGLIARPGEKNDGGELGTEAQLQLDVDNPYFSIVGTGLSIVGDTVHKVGYKTGWTSGTVDATCLSAYFWSDHYGCQDRASFESLGGDSGSPVFRILDGNEVKLLGIHTSFGSNYARSRQILDRRLYGDQTVTIRFAQSTPCDSQDVVDQAETALKLDCELLWTFYTNLFNRGTLDDSDDAVAWGSHTQTATWRGVTVSGTPQRVTGLNLSGLGLSGPISPELGYLSGLVSLDLSMNDLEGPIPDSLGELDQLTTLSLANNRFDGHIPIELGDLAALQQIDLSNNQLSGPIPTQLDGLTNLETLRLDGNQLTDTIPTQLGTLTNLETLNLSNNRLSGDIPTQFGSLGSLQVLHLDDNELTGTIPTQLGSLTQLVIFTAGANDLDGSIPTQLGTLSALQTLDLHDNTLSRPIPTQLGGLTDLQSLRLDDNNLSGDVPSQLGDLVSLTRLELAGNELTGCVPASLDGIAGDLGGLPFCTPESSVPTPATTATSITDTTPSTTTDRCERGIAVSNAAEQPSLVADCKTLVSARDMLAGDRWLNWSAEVPIGSWEGVSLGGSPSRITSIRLPYTDINGTIPPPMGSLSGLEKLELQSNGLAGRIPPELGNLTSLVKLDLGANRLKGTVPGEIGNLSNLKVLDLLINRLDGTIPSELGDLSNLQVLLLGENSFTGSIPSDLGRLSELTHLDLRANRLSDSIPSELGDLSKVVRLNLSRNTLTGPIPSEFGNLAAIKYLRLERNRLSGWIPVELTALEHLFELFLNRNQLVGCVPHELDVRFRNYGGLPVCTAIAQADSTDVYTGQTVTLTAMPARRGMAVELYRWQQQLDSGWHDAPVDHGPEKPVVFTTPGPRTYRVQITYPSGDVVESDPITIEWSTFVTIAVDESNPFAGRSATLTAVLADPDADVDHQWQRQLSTGWRNSPTDHDENWKITFDSPGARTYRVVVTLDSGVVTSSESVTVDWKPFVEIEADEQRPRVGQSTTLTAVLADPSVHVDHQWQRQLSTGWRNSPTDHDENWRITFDSPGARTYRVIVTLDDGTKSASPPITIEWVE